MISFRIDGKCHVGVYRTNRRIGVLYWDRANKIWCFSVAMTEPGRISPCFTIIEMQDIIGMMCALWGPADPPE